MTKPTGKPRGRPRKVVSLDNAKQPKAKVEKKQNNNESNQNVKEENKNSILDNLSSILGIQKQEEVKELKYEPRADNIDVPDLVEETEDIKLNNSLRRKVAVLNKSLKKTDTDSDSDSDDSISSDSSDEVKKPSVNKLQEEAKRNELYELVLANPQILQAKIHKGLKTAIDDMPMDEVRERLILAKRQLTSSMDNALSHGFINIINMVVGRTLGCIDELQEQTRSNSQLQDSAKNVLCFGVLDKLSPHIKLAAIYSCDVAAAITNKKIKNRVAPPQPTLAPPDNKPEVKEPKVEPKQNGDPDLSHLKTKIINAKDILSNIAS